MGIDFKTICGRCKRDLTTSIAPRFGWGFIGFFLFIMLLFHWGDLEAAYVGILKDWAENGLTFVKVVINNG